MARTYKAARKPFGRKYASRHADIKRRPLSPLSLTRSYKRPSFYDGLSSNLALTLAAANGSSEMRIVILLFFPRPVVVSRRPENVAVRDERLFDQKEPRVPRAFTTVRLLVKTARLVVLTCMYIYARQINSMFYVAI